MIYGEVVRKAEMLKVLGHPIRLAIAKGLIKHPCQVTKIVEQLDIPQSTISQHIGKLRAAGIIKGERKGVCICYKVVDDFVEKLLELI